MKHPGSVCTKPFGRWASRRTFFVEMKHLLDAFSCCQHIKLWAYCITMTDTKAVGINYRQHLGRAVFEGTFVLPVIVNVPVIKQPPREQWYLLQLGPNVFQMELHSVSCIELQPVGWRLQCAHVKGQQVVDIVIGRLVIQPHLRLPESMALETAANKVSVDKMQRRPQLLQSHGKCEGKATE